MREIIVLELSVEEHESVTSRAGHGLGIELILKIPNKTDAFGMIKTETDHEPILNRVPIFLGTDLRFNIYICSVKPKTKCSQKENKIRNQQTKCSQKENRNFREFYCHYKNRKGRILYSLASRFISKGKEKPCWI